MDSVSRILLSTLRLHLNLDIEEIEGDESWELRATAEDGQVYIAKGEDPYEAAVALAELVGFELEDG